MQLASNEDITGVFERQMRMAIDPPKAQLNEQYSILNDIKRTLSEIRALRRARLKSKTLARSAKT